MSDTITNPFVGLRPFKKEESHLFFGREEQVDDVLEKLVSNRLTTILGNSGAGKSSFVYCSLLPTLENGFEINGFSKWDSRCFYPGTKNPVNNLLRNLQIEPDSQLHQDLLSDYSLLIRHLQENTESESNILLFIDQFEELFRCENPKEIGLFLDFILYLVNQTELPIYVLATIRSDSVGFCSEYPSYTKKMNSGQYLLPRMTQEQKRLAIVKPIELCGAEISETLVKRLLEEENSEKDQLPVMQHALMRMWDYWKETGGSRVIGIWEYEAVGTMKKALSIHANEIFNELLPEKQALTEKIFRIITTNEEGREIRNPEKISKIAQITENYDYQELFSIINKFREEGRSFVLPPPQIPLSEETIIDISHESLIQIWNLLQTWIEKENESAKQYIRLAEKAALYQEGKVSRLRGAELQLLLSWRKEEMPTKQWAAKYHSGFETAMLFLDYCEKKERDESKRKIALRKNKLRFQRVLILIFFLIGIAGAILAFYALNKREEADRAKEIAETKATEAQIEKEKANKQQRLAEEKAKEALTANKEAKRQKLNAISQALKALKAKEEALKQRKMAEENLSKAEKATKEAIVAKNEAFRQRQQATKQREKAEKLFFLAESKALADKSISVLHEGDENIAINLALHAYFLNKENEGPRQIEAIYSALDKCLRSKLKNIDIRNTHEQGVTSIAYNPRNNTFATSANDGSLSFWKAQDMATGEVNKLSTLPQQGRIASVNYFDNNTKICVASENKLLVFDTSDPKLPKELFVQKLDAPIKKTCTSGVNHEIMAVQTKDKIELFTFKNKQFEKISEIGILALSCFTIRKQDEKLLLAFAENETKLKVILIDHKNPHLLDTLAKRNLEKKITALAYSPDGKYLAIGTSTGGIEIASTKTYQTKMELLGHKGYIKNLKFNPITKEQLVSASLDKTVRLWIIDSEKNEESIKIETELWSNQVEFTPDGQRLMVVGEDRALRFCPTHPQLLAEQLCGFVKNKLSDEQMKKYSEADIIYTKTNCVSKK